MNFTVKHLDRGWMMMESDANDCYYSKYINHLQENGIKEYSSSISVKGNEFKLMTKCNLKKRKDDKDGFVKITNISSEEKRFGTLSDAMIAGDQFLGI